MNEQPTKQEIQDIKKGCLGVFGGCAGMSILTFLGVAAAAGLVKLFIWIVTL